MNWEEFIKNKSGKLLNYISKFVRIREDAEDIMQFSFIELLRNAHKLDELYLEQWLYRVAHNKAVNLIKKNNIHKKYAPIVEYESELNQNQELRADDSKKDKIRQCFQTLKPNEAFAIELQYYQKKTYKEIAETMGLSVSAVESILVRAKKQIKKRLQEIESQIVIGNERS